MDKSNFFKRYLIGKFVVFCLLAIAVLIIREIFVENLKYFIGGLMLLYGIEQLIIDLILNKQGDLKNTNNYLGFINLLLGMTLILANISFEGVCIIWATWSILRECIEVKESVIEIKNLPISIISGIESIVIIVFSVILIVNPTEHHALIHTFLLAAELILNPLVFLVDEFYKAKHE